jgi:hypothetical protein
MDDHDSYQGGSDSYQDFEKEPLNSAAVDRDSSIKEPKYFVLEPQTDNNRDSAKDSSSAVADETEPLQSPKTPTGESRPRRYRPKRPHPTRNDTVV